MSDLRERLQAFVGTEHRPPYTGPDEVNGAMIRTWCHAVGDRNPVYTDPDAAARSRFGGIVAPPAMLAVWPMRAQDIELLPEVPIPHADAPDVMRTLEEEGYTAVVATNSEQEFVRYLRPGDRITKRWEVEAVSDEKRTALGSGFFITFLYTFTDQDGEVVGRERFRLLKFKPAGRPQKQPRPKPVVTPDNAFFWDGVASGLLLVQRCTSCKTLRHPPRPMCPSCTSVEWDTVESSGRGTVFSYIVPRHPELPMYEQPYVVVLVDLEEGVRLLSNLVGVAPDEVGIGLPVEVVFEAPDGETILPLFRARS